MGAVLGICSIASWVPCLCSGAACLLCRCCPSTNNSTVTRLVYAFVLLLSTLLSCIMLAPGIEEQLKKIPGFCEGGFGTQLPHVDGYVNCDVLVGYKAVYRISFAMAIFFFLFAALMINVKSSKDARAPVHNGFWFFKIIAIVGIMVGAFYIPEGPFTRAWFVIGTFGAFCFIVIQLVLLVDFAHSWNESWVDRMEDGNSKCWYAEDQRPTPWNTNMAHHQDLIHAPSNLWKDFSCGTICGGWFLCSMATTTVNCFNL